MRKMVTLCTYEEAILISQVEGIHPMDMDAQEEIDYTIDDMLDQNYLDPIFGSLPKISLDKWKENSRAMQGISQIWYDAEKLRTLCFVRAGIPTDSNITAFKDFCTANNVKFGDDEGSDFGLDDFDD